MHSGYQESFIAVDMNYNHQDSEIKIPNGNDGSGHDQEFCNLSWRNATENCNKIAMEIHNSMNKNTMIEDNFMDSDKFRKYSADDGIMREPELRKRTLSLMIERMDGKNSNNKLILS